MNLRIEIPGQIIGDGEEAPQHTGGKKHDQFSPAYMVVAKTVHWVA